MVRIIGTGLAILCLGFVGCATTSHNSNATVTPESVNVSTSPRTGCERVGDVKVVCDSKKEVEGAVQQEASRLGANFVQLKSLAQGTVTGKYTVRGVAFLCQK